MCVMPLVKISSDDIPNKRLAINDEGIVSKILSEAPFGYLGLSEGGNPYVVPLNYVWHNDSIYVHGSTSGRKGKIISRNPNSTFVVSQALGTISDPVPAKTDTAYLSVMVFGKILHVDRLEEATSALEALLSKYVPGYYERPLEKEHVARYVSSMGNHVGVYRIDPEKITAKRNEDTAGMMFYPGRTQYGDLMKKLQRRQSR